MDEAIRQKVLKAAIALIDAHKVGALGGELMPEDENPGLDPGSLENYLYFTLPMALNYQRNSYKLWAAANKTYLDEITGVVFNPHLVSDMDDSELRSYLTAYGVALQPNKHIQIWRTLCSTLCGFHNDVRVFIEECGGTVASIKDYMTTNKKAFPYLSGPKIMNYWLYVLIQYTDANFPDRHNITVAPDTHVLRSSRVLGLIPDDGKDDSATREKAAEAWREIFEGTEYEPIDIHTPLWLWSRSGFEFELGGDYAPVQGRLPF